MNYHCDKCGQHFPLCEVCEKNQAVTTAIHSFTVYLCPDCARKLITYLRSTEDYAKFIYCAKIFDYFTALKDPAIDMIKLLQPVYEAETEVNKLIDGWVRANRPSQKAKVLKLVKH